MRAPFPLRSPAVGAGAWLGILLGLVLSLAVRGARADDGETAQGEPTWIPSLSFDFETFQYSTNTSITNLVNPPAQEGTVSDDSAELVARIEGELMSPKVESLPWDPRFFVSGGVGFSAFSGTKIADIGVLQGDTQTAIQLFRILRRQDFNAGCNNRNPPTCITADAADFEGQGSAVRGELDTPEWNASLGVAFGFPLMQSLLLHVKPSITYNYEKVKLGGVIRTVVEEPPGPTYPTQEVFSVYEGMGKGSSTNHSLGMGLGLDLALFRSTRPVRASIYVDTRFLWLLSGRTTTFSDSSGTYTTYPEPPPPNPPPVVTPYSPVATYRVVRDDFEIRAGAGIRLSWVGFAR